MRKYLASKVIYWPFFMFGASIFISAFVPSLNYFWGTLVFSGGCQAIVATGLLIIASKITPKTLKLSIHFYFIRSSLSGPSLCSGHLEVIFILAIRIKIKSNRSVTKRCANTSMPLTNSTFKRGLHG